MAVKVGINGFGRIGRNVFRAALGNPETPACRGPPPFTKKSNPGHTSPRDLGDPRIRPRPGARRVCPPRRRRIAAAGSGRKPNAARSWTWAR